MKKQKTSCFIPLLLFLFLLTGLLLLWVGMPMLAQRDFGKCSDSLTAFQCWKYSTMVVVQKSVLLEPGIGSKNNVEFQIAQDERVADTAANLQTQGLIKDGKAFLNYLVFKGLDSQVKSGTYNLSSGISPIEIAEVIRSNKSTVDFFIYPGWRAEEIAAALPASGIEVSPEAFLRIVQNPSLIPEETIVSGFPSTEGFLFPGEYEISRVISAEELALVFVRKFESNFDVEISRGFEQNGLTLYEGITLASIIQRESFQQEERAAIASVFYNRLAIGMKLETDPTVQYALGASKKWDGWWKTPLRIGDLDIDSPYNTYLIYGLPPAPISNPDISAIRAAAFPESTSYYFFRATCDDTGFHTFSITFEEHAAKSCQ